MRQTIAVIGTGPGISRSGSNQFSKAGYDVALVGRTVLNGCRYTFYESSAHAPESAG
ncbi:hypothetical protein [Spirosoma arcticum]